MPIDTDSDKWQDGGTFDPLRVEINNFLNDGEAYTLEEIDEYLSNNEKQVFPTQLLGDDESAKSVRIAFVANQLERLRWLDHVDARRVDGEIYYSTGEEFRYPLPEIRYEIPDQIEEVEKKLEDEKSELEERIGYLEHRFQQEIGRL